MKKIAFTLLAMLISNGATAEWVRIGGGADDSEIYMDLETFRRNGDKVKLWTMETFKTLTSDDSKHKYFSKKTQREFDCKEELNRVLVYITFSGKKGKGEVLDNEYSPHSSWYPMSPGSVGQMIFETGCHTTIGTHEWTLMEPSDELAKTNPDLTAYFDYSSIQKNGNRVSMWQLVDRRGKDHDPKSQNHSVKFHREYDCIEKKVRSISVAMYLANMGIGKVYEIDNVPSPWKEEKGQLQNAIWKMVCEDV